MPEISVIVPVYKVEPYLRRCVDSILAQTFTDIEVILVDDGSPDGCPAICDEYAQQDNRVKVIHQENGGLSAARNAGLDWVFANSNSRWISFVDSDDWVHPCFLEYLHRAAAESRVDISVCEYHKESVYFTSLDFVEYTAHKITSLQLYQYFNRNLLFTIVCNKLYSRFLFSDTRFPVGKLSEDTFLTYKLMYKCSQVALIEYALYFYYVNQTSITNSAYTPARLAELDAMKLQKRFFSEHGAIHWEKACIQRMIPIYALHISMCRKNPALKCQEKILIREFRHFLIKNRKHYILPFRKNIWIYEMAYPKSMAIYWKIKYINSIRSAEELGEFCFKVWKKIWHYLQ